MSNIRISNDSPSTTITETSETNSRPDSGGETLILRLSGQETNNGARVHWSTNTVDNEHMNKKKSKCCCIYKKQRRWDEDSSGSDEEMETEHCRGHVEKKCNH
ncbi:Protein phosphatase 1 regulatory subunit 11 [Strongyloides ratti]|uniref:E3 ubiquitin-protein ligase PPP1R11 n=1 Tax=Strongyloides ratti TaxID=34506 RepID=A0A090L4G5_STRRB|nr:Protein phosphatase 1 regulatory subunit 11 [Strongyloides ratti]CEF64607.1 Protein phosphatase 1 regulatory subunit 11 [Strongyloides ratti]